jgi:hypothetical protein
VLRMWLNLWSSCIFNRITANVPYMAHFFHELRVRLISFDLCPLTMFDS